MAKFNAVRLVSSVHSTPWTVNPGCCITGREVYDRWAKDNLWRYVDTKHALLIQHDGFIWHPEAWDERFLDYDYIGAPWWYNDNHNVCCGGFCLMSRQLLEYISNLLWERVVPLDEVICRDHGDALRAAGFTFAPESLAARFCLEWNDKHCDKGCGSFGIHGRHTLENCGVRVYG